MPRLTPNEMNEARDDINSEIEEIEKEVKGIVKIDLEEKPKKVRKKKAIQNIKPVKKTHYKPLIKEIPEEKAKEIVDKINENYTGTKIETLKKEIEAKKKLIELNQKKMQEEEEILKQEEKARKKAEKKERKKNRWYRRMFKGKPEFKQPILNPNEIRLVEANDTILKVCPVCQSKIKKTKIQKELECFRQIFKCSKCPFSKEIVIRL